jgi:DNA-directed RNA polymerase subunit RPC12/RpoP
MSEICENCGAEMSWDPDADALRCPYCETERAVAAGEDLIMEHPLEAAGDLATGLGLSMRVGRCDNCGAAVAFGEAATADRCVYCGSPEVLEQELNRNAIRPESLVPLDVGRETVDRNLKRWRDRLWFRPNALKKVTKFEAVGIYVPFWTFDCDVDSHWWAESGTYYWVTETYTTVVNGKTVTRTRQVRKTRWRPASGSRRDRYDDILVCASVGIPKNLIDRLGDFDTDELVPYKPEYLAGWRAEEYQIDLDGGWEEGARIVKNGQYSRCGSDVPGDTHRNLSVENHIYDIHFKHVLLPVWSAAYRFKGKSYPVLVNGQTGRVTGEAPFSWVKILLFVLMLVGVAGGVALLVAMSS